MRKHSRQGGNITNILSLIQIINTNIFRWSIALCRMLGLSCYSLQQNNPCLPQPIVLHPGSISTTVIQKTDRMLRIPSALGQLSNTPKRNFVVSLACRDHLAQSGDHTQCSTIVLTQPRLLCEIWTKEDWDNLVKVTKISGAQVTMIFSNFKQLSGPWYQGSWWQHGAHLGPTGPRLAPCWPHELCYLGWFACMLLSRSQIIANMFHKLPIQWNKYRIYYH